MGYESVYFFILWVPVTGIRKLKKDQLKTSLQTSFRTLVWKHFCQVIVVFQFVLIIYCPMLTVMSKKIQKLCCWINVVLGFFPATSHAFHEGACVQRWGIHRVRSKNYILLKRRNCMDASSCCKATNTCCMDLMGTCLNGHVNIC